MGRVIGIWEGLWWQPIRGDKLHSIHRIPGSADNDYFNQYMKVRTVFYDE